GGGCGSRPAVDGGGRPRDPTAGRQLRQPRQRRARARQARGCRHYRRTPARRRLRRPPGLAAAHRPGCRSRRRNPRHAHQRAGLRPAAARARVDCPIHSPRRAAVLKKAAATIAAALAAVGMGLAFAQAPDLPQPSKPQPAALSDSLPIPPAPVPGKAAAWLLMDYATGQVLAGENIHARREPASITKVMTSYVIAAEMAAGKISEDDQVLMSEHAWRTGGAATDGSYSGFPVNQ